MSLQNKYLKYKKKYIYLKNQIGGASGGASDDTEKIVSEIIIENIKSDDITSLKRISIELKNKLFTDIYSNVKLYNLESNELLLHFNDKIHGTQYKFKFPVGFPFILPVYLQIYNYKFYIDDKILDITHNGGTFVTSRTCIMDLISYIIGYKITQEENNYWMNPIYKNGFDLFFSLKFDDSGPKHLGPKKLVATPNSGQMPRYRLNQWLELDEDNKHLITKILYPKLTGSELGVFIYRYKDGSIPPKNTPGIFNIIIYYLDKYLKLLAIASNKTTDELLTICALVDDSYISTVNGDLIKIAFGDIFGNGYDRNPLNTEEGRSILATYLELIK